MVSKVVWREGMFLRPQHFQQHEQHLAAEIDNRCRQMGLYPWGFSHLEINQANLQLGELSIDACVGTFPDGTSFDSQRGDALPPAIKVDEALTDAKVYLALPLRHEGVAEFGENDKDNSLVRYTPKIREANDVVGGDGGAISIEMGELRIRLFIEQAGSDPDRMRVPDGYVRLAIAHIDEVSGGKIRLRKEFIPTSQSIGASLVLGNFLAELQSMLAARARELAGRASEGAGRGGVAEVTDFMLLQVLNRFDPRLSLLRQAEGLHPFSLYTELASFAGELATFFTNEKRPQPFPEYQHDNLQTCFAPVMQALTAGFGTVSRQIATPIPLSPPQYGIRAARINDRSLLSSADFVFAVSADVAQEKLRTQFPAQIKIGPVEKIRELVTSAVPGIPIHPLPVAPREIPYHAGFTYFALDTGVSDWKELGNSGGIAFHIGGEFPGLECQFYAIRRR